MIRLKDYKIKPSKFHDLIEIAERVLFVDLEKKDLERQ